MIFETSRDRPSRRHIQGSKIAKRLPSVKYSLLQYSKIENFTKKKFSKKLHTQKMDLVALKGGHFRNCQHFCRSWRGFVGKHQKIEKWRNFYFRKKNLTVPKKTERGGPFGIFQHPFCRKTAKKLKGTFWGKKFSGKISLAVPKKIGRGTLWSPRVWYGTRKNRKNRFGSVR